MSHATLQPTPLKSGQFLSVAHGANVTDIVLTEARGGWRVAQCHQTHYRGQSKSYFVASVGAVSAETVRRYIDTQYERPWRKGA